MVYRTKIKIVNDFNSELKAASGFEPENYLEIITNIWLAVNI